MTHPTPSSRRYSECLVVDLLAEHRRVVIEVVHQLELPLPAVARLQPTPDPIRLLLAQAVVYYVAPHQHDVLLGQQLRE